MYKAKHNKPKSHHRHLTRVSRSNFKQKKIITKATSFVISSRGSKIWKNYLHEFEKKILYLPLFLNKLKNKLLEFENKLAFFYQSKLQLIIEL